MPATLIEVNIDNSINYCVRIGEGILTTLGNSLRSISEVANCSQLAIITDSNVAPLYLSSVKNTLVSEGYKVSDIVVDAGENSKSAEVISEIWDALARLEMNRDCAIVALGGGVIGDLAGFAAATFMRGIPVVQVPTTLLAMVDSSVGGKTGINLEVGKNLIGAFWQPSFVNASIDTLSTLNEREWSCGLGEVAKSAVIDSDNFFFWLCDNASLLRNRDTQTIEEAVKRCVVFKAGVVAEDQKESKGVRECLNYGHTLAHAIESLTGYGTISHGAAVAEGMRFAAFLASRVNDASPDFVSAQSELLDSLGLARLDWVSTANEHLFDNADSATKSLTDPSMVQLIVDCMKHDKKTRGGKLRFVLVRDVANWSVVEVDDDTVASALKDFYEI